MRLYNRSTAYAMGLRCYSNGVVCTCGEVKRDVYTKECWGCGKLSSRRHRLLQTPMVAEDYANVELEI